MDKYTICISIAVGYLLLCRILRYRLRDAGPKRYGIDISNRETFTKISLKQSYEIHYDLISLESPFMYDVAAFCAFLRTFAIPRISKLLVSTNQIAPSGCPMNVRLSQASKRYSDTAVLLAEIVSNPPDHPRALSAIARINYLHSPYIKAGKIKNDEMLYTLSMFALQGGVCMNLYGWRKLAGWEQCGLGVFWQNFGHRLGINYDCLYEMKSTGDAKGMFKDGLEWIDLLAKWSEEYEKKHMVPAESNAILIGPAFDCLKLRIPRPLRAHFTSLVYVQFGERMCKALKVSQPSRIHYYTFWSIIAIYQFVLRYLSLPRFKRRRLVSADSESKDGRHHHMTDYLLHPWYMLPTSSFDWSLDGLSRWMIGVQLPRNDQPQFKPEGFLTEDVGPDRSIGKGKKEMERDIDKMRECQGDIRTSIYL